MKESHTSVRCLWTEVDLGETIVWETTCGQTWQFMDSGPRDNKTRFCHYCGGKAKFLPLQVQMVIAKLEGKDVPNNPTPF